MSTITSLRQKEEKARRAWEASADWPSFAEAHTEWKRIHNESTPIATPRRKRRVLTIHAPKSPLGM
jgi:hypothetical protein